MERVYDGFLKIDLITRLADNGKEVTREIVRRKQSVACLLYDTDTDEIVLVKQFRDAVGDKMIEVLAGVVDDGEEPIEALKREAIEEVGYELKNITHITSYYPTCGYTDEIIHLYIATGIKVSSGGGLETEGEFIEIIKMNKDEFVSFNFIDGKTIISQFYYKLVNKY